MRPDPAARLRGATAVVGFGQAGMGEAGAFSALELLSSAVLAALADAGLGLADVDGLFVGTAVHAMPTLSVAEYLGIRPRYSDGSMIGGASFTAHALTAAMALEAGLCDVAVVAYGSNQRSAGGFASISEPQPYEAPYRPRYPVSAYALAASRHMHEFGTTREQLAEVAVAARAWARHNPEAFERGPLTHADVLGARMVSDPLTVRDCCLVTDGAAAIVMVRADRAADAPNPPVYLLGAATEHWHRQISSMPDVTTTAASVSGPRALAMAGLALEEIDVVGLYDAFTITTLLFLEDLGFCPKGEAGRFVEDGAIAPGGRLPVNTNGGGLSCVHPGMYGLFLVVEAVRQLRGAAPGLQVPGAATALVHANGGTLSSQSTLILGSRAAL
jgi:acetyl-CoA acetyltransferase